MEGVVQVEKVLHLPFAPLTIVQGQKGEGQQRAPLDGPQVSEKDGQKDQSHQR